MEELTLDGRPLGCIPPALLAATRLRRLVFPNRMRDSERLAVSRADVDGVLLRLPRLEHLDLRGARLATATAIHLARAAPRLEILAADNEAEI